MKILRFLLGFIYVALIVLLILTVKNCNKPVYEDDDEELIDDEEETDEDDLDLTEQWGQGELQISLLWDFEGDLDLHVIEPGGFEIGWIDPVDGRDGYVADSSPNGGTLDHDERSSGIDSGENIFWENPPSGTYRIEVVYYRKEEGGPQSPTAKVIVKQEGSRPKTYKVRLKAPREEESEDGETTTHRERTFVAEIKVR